MVHMRRWSASRRHKSFELKIGSCRGERQAAVKFEVWKRDGSKCVICGATD